MRASTLTGAESFLTGTTLVHAGRIQSAIQNGHYDLEDPFSQDPDHLQAIKYSSLREEEDSGGQSLSARLALEGSGFAVGGRDAAWTAGVELGRSKSHSLLRFRSNDGMTHKVTEVLGSGGTSYAGERETAAAFGEVSLPLADKLDLRVAGRGVEFDDVGGLESWRLGAEYRASDIVTLRGSWGAGEGAPSMGNLYSTEAQGHPYILYDPGPGTPPRTCAAAERPAGGHARSRATGSSILRTPSGSPSAPRPARGRSSWPRNGIGSRSPACRG